MTTSPQEAATRRQRLAIRTIVTSFSSGLSHAPPVSPERERWLSQMQQRAERLLDELESRFLILGPIAPEIQLEIRVARAAIRNPELPPKDVS